LASSAETSSRRIYVQAWTPNAAKSSRCDRKERTVDVRRSDGHRRDLVEGGGFDALSSTCVRKTTSDKAAIDY
jgi:hypothetical protein